MTKVILDVDTGTDDAAGSAPTAAAWSATR
jgi:inosine-uridine nucleoside N-ribohydrolase